MFSTNELSAYFGVDHDPTTWTDVQAVEAAKPPPEIPPPVWDSRPINADACAAATRAMCA